MHLYKYCSFGANSLSILINRKVWYCKPADFNDPFDGDFYLDTSCTFEDFQTIYGLETPPGLHEAVKSAYCDSNGMVKNEVIEKERWSVDVLKNIGVLCLTPSRDNVLMWSHYADEHRGFSIKFDIPESIPVNKINYAIDLPNHHLSFFAKRPLSANNGYLDFQYTKHLNWKYEDEHRILVSGGNRLVDLPGRIIEINFGCQMPDSHKETISNMVKMLPDSEDVKLFSAVKCNRLSLSFEAYG